MSKSYKTKFDFGEGLKPYLTNGGDKSFLENNTPDQIAIFEREAQKCLGDFDAAQVFIDSRMGAGGWQMALKYGWGACRQSTTALYKNKADCEARKNGRRPPAIVIPLKNADGEIVGLQQRRFLSYRTDNGEIQFQNFDEVADELWQWFPQDDDGTFKPDTVPDPRYFSRGNKGLLNYGDELFHARVVFVVEGLFDWLALKMAGFNAVCLNGATYNCLITFLENKEIPSTLVFCSDNDSKAANKKGSGAGTLREDDARRIFSNAVECRGIRVLKKGFLVGQSAETRAWLDANGIKDAADFWQKGINNAEIRARFFAHFGELEKLASQGGELDYKVENPTKSVADIRYEIAEERRAAESQKSTDESKNENSTDESKIVPPNPFSKAAPLKITNARDALEGGFYADFVAANKQLGCFPTPWPTLNNFFDGGFFPRELIVFGGTPNIGKTAMALQIADFVAQSGKRVLYFSLEMPKGILISRSLARFGAARGFNEVAASYANGFASPEAYKIASADFLNAVGDRLTYIEGRPSGMDTLDVYRIVEQAIMQTGERPLVIIDYFQILRSNQKGERALEKEKVDGVVFELKQTAIDLEVPILAISTLARDSYNRPLTISCYKESGSIEFTADKGIVLAPLETELNPARAGAKLEDSPEYKFQMQIADFGKGDVVLKILKNRGSGGKGLVNLITEPAKEIFTEGRFGEHFYSNGEPMAAGGAYSGASAEIISADRAARAEHAAKMAALRETKENAQIAKIQAQIRNLEARTANEKSKLPSEPTGNENAALVPIITATPPTAALLDGNPPWQN